jgi:hypothetical protein
VPIENRTIEQIYEAALAEGNGTLVVYSGGTAQSLGDQTKQAFEARFPGLTVNVIVDYSIFHGPRIDVQSANNSVIPDVVQLQTVQDFPRWKQQGLLMEYRPANYSVVHDEYKDVDGFYTGTLVIVLGTLVNQQLIPSAGDWPRTADALLQPRFANGQIIAVHPNSDDAVLFYFKQVILWSLIELSKIGLNPPISGSLNTPKPTILSPKHSNPKFSSTEASDPDLTPRTFEIEISRPVKTETENRFKTQPTSLKSNLDNLSP